MADSENKVKKIDWKGVIGGVTSFFSIVFLIVSPSWFSAIAGSGYVALILFLGILVCYYYSRKEKDWAKSVLYLLIPLFITSCISAGRTWFTDKRVHHGEIVADATESIVNDFLQDNTKGWIEDAMNSGELVCFLVPSASWKGDEEFMYGASDMTKYKAAAEAEGLTSKTLQVRVTHYKYKTVEEESTAKYLVGYANGRFLKDGWEKKYDVEILPASTLTLVKGVRALQHRHWEKARKLFYQADSLGNAAGTEWLSHWYSVGYGQNPDSTEYRDNLSKAALNGSRIARFNWSEKILKDSKSSAVDKAKAEEYLKKASLLKTIVTLTTIDYSEKAVKLLNKYYVSTGRNLKAYYFTKKYLRGFDDPYIRYSEHLANCLNLGFNREALRIVRNGEKESNPNCFYIHGRMYAKGVAERKNPDKAEELLRYAADSLHYRKAYLGLASLYRNLGRDGDDFWYMMYEADFNDSIE